MQFLKNVKSGDKKSFVTIFNLVFLLAMLLFFNPKTFAQHLNIQKNKCRLSKDDTETLNQIANYEADFYNAVFDTSKNDSLVITVNIFGKKADFLQTPDGAGALHVSSDGYFLETTNQVYLLKTDHVNDALLHEISHAFLHQNFKNPPKWFDEGLATYLGSLIVQDKKIFYTPVTGRIARIKELNDKKKIDLTAFLQNKTRNWGDEQKEISDQYTIAYSIIYFLVKTNLNLVKQLAVQLKTEQPVTEIFAQMFGGFESFKSRYTNFYNQQN